MGCELCSSCWYGVNRGDTSSSLPDSLVPVLTLTSPINEHIGDVMQSLKINYYFIIRGMWVI